MTRRSPPSASPTIPRIAAPADVCLLVEGTYPFVSGGVSSWVHDIICGHPELTFAVLYVGSYPGAHGEPRFKLPPNVVGLHRVFCQDAALAPLDGAGRATLREQIHSLRVAMDARPAKSRVLAGLERMHVEGEAGTDVLAALASNDLTLPELMHGRSSFQLLTTIAERVAPDAPFLDLFWHYRAIFAPVLRLLAAPDGGGALLSRRRDRLRGAAGRPVEPPHRPAADGDGTRHLRARARHGARARGLDPRRGGRRVGAAFDLGAADLAAPAPLVVVLQGAVAHRLRPGAPHHHAVGRQPEQADRRRRAAREDRDRAQRRRPARVIAAVAAVAAAGRRRVGTTPVAPPARRLRVGFVGRVVPIKDLVTFVRACDIALAVVDVEARVIGPSDEDPGYAARCRQLVARLGRTSNIQFVGPMPPAQIYGDLDLVVLTSFSEGQPLVILEAYAWGVPVVATDVGACREMIEGRGEEDRRIGPSGFVTRVAAPKETAAAIVRLARDVQLRWRMGAAGHQRVTAYLSARGHAGALPGAVHVADRDARAEAAERP